MKKVSVIGGSGFIGSQVCELLNAAEIQFEIIDIKPPEKYLNKYKYADVREKTQLAEMISGSVVINLAAEHRDDILDKNSYFKTNVLGAKNICEVCEIKNIKHILFTSSVAVIGYLQTTDSDYRNDINYYGKSKLEAEEIFKTWAQKNNSNLTIIRPTVVFGEKNRGNMYNLLRLIASPFFVIIGSGENIKSIAYVGNLAGFILHCVNLKNRGVILFHYADKPDLTMRQLVDYVSSVLDKKQYFKFSISKRFSILIFRVIDFLYVKAFSKKFVINADRIEKFCADTKFDSDHEKVGFAPPFLMKDALRRTIESEFIKN